MQNKAWVVLRRILFGQLRFLSGVFMSLPLKAFFAMLLLGISHLNVITAIPPLGFIDTMVFMLLLAFLFPSREHYVGAGDKQDSFEQTND